MGRKVSCADTGPNERIDGFLRWCQTGSTTFEDVYASLLPVSGWGGGRRLVSKEKLWVVVFGGNEGSNPFLGVMTLGK